MIQIGSSDDEMVIVTDQNEVLVTPHTCTTSAAARDAALHPQHSVIDETETEEEEDDEEGRGRGREEGGVGGGDESIQTNESSLKKRRAEGGAGQESVEKRSRRVKPFGGTSACHEPLVDVVFITEKGDKRQSDLDGMHV